MAEPRRVVITGGNGRIGRSIAPALASRWRLTVTDRRPGPSVESVDVLDLGACRLAFEGADAVVHLAAVPSPDAPWEELLPANIVGAYNVAQAAIDSQVRRLVLASSLHAVSAVPDRTQVRADDQAQPANLYGATKVWAEALASWVAATSATSAVALRIGYFSEGRPDPRNVSVRERAAWLSGRDAAELVRAAVETEGVRFFVGNGTSANRHQRAEPEQTMRILAYRPLDDAWGEG